MALGPFARDAGSAAALLGFLQIAVGGVVSVGVGFVPPGQMAPIIAGMAACSVAACAVLWLGRRAVPEPAA